MKNKEVVSRERREFFRKAGLGVGALGAAAVTLGVTEEAEAAVEPRKGYQESEHVKRYYELARF
ncbi:MAG TPA: formate dehydrogenase [Kiloniellales bacterium]|nr:formate dehydrogenase [Kiloniellales bacterium]